jgi:hypothetical protein
MNPQTKSNKILMVLGGALIGAMASIFLSSINDGLMDGPTFTNATKKNIECSSTEYLDPTSNTCLSAGNINIYPQNPASYDYDNVEVRIAAAVNGLIPNINLQAKDVTYIESADLYAFFIGGKIFYTTENVKALITGDVLDVEMLKKEPEKSNITKEFTRIYNGGVSEESTSMQYNIKSLDLSKTINIGLDSASKKIAIMFDISCPKSKELYPKLIEILSDNKDVQFNLMLISRTGSASVEKKSREIFCSANNSSALDFYIKTSIQDQSRGQVKDCKFDPNYPAMLMGEAFSGTTPVFYGQDNRVLVGNKQIELIRSFIEGK